MKVTGTVHTWGTVTTDANGGFHVIAHQTFQGQGVGETSDDKYIINDSIHHPGGALSSGANTFTFTDVRQVIRQGSTTPQDDLLFVHVFHVTINANGEVTSETDQVKLECQ